VTAKFHRISKVLVILLRAKFVKASFVRLKEIVRLTLLAFRVSLANHTVFKAFYNKLI